MVDLMKKAYKESAQRCRIRAMLANSAKERKEFMKKAVHYEMLANNNRSLFTEESNLEIR